MRALGLEADEFGELSALILSKGGTFSFRARGSSMEPFIRDGDRLTIQPVDAFALKLGDIVLYRAGEEHLAAHRVVGRRVVEGRLVLTACGDASPRAGEEVRAEQVLGRAVSRQRGDRTLFLERRLPRSAARLWGTTAPLGPWLLGALVRLKHLASCLLRSLGL